MVSARIAEIVLRDERAVIPIGCYGIPAYGVTLSLPAIVGRQGVVRFLEPAMSADERQALQRGADTLRAALAHVGSFVTDPGQANALRAERRRPDKAPPGLTLYIALADFYIAIDFQADAL